MSTNYFEMVRKYIYAIEYILKYITYMDQKYIYIYIKREHAHTHIKAKRQNVDNW